MSRYSSQSNAPIPGIAPDEAIRRDYENLSFRTKLRCSEDIEQLLFIQSVEGHCHSGYGNLYGKTYPNTTQLDVAKALRLDPQRVKEDRQDIIDEVSIFVDRIIRGENITWACNGEGEPLTRCGFLRHIPIDPRGLLQGLYLGGYRDAAGVREMANRQYGINMGYGRNMLVNRSVMHRLGLDGFELARKPHEHDMPRFTSEGLFAKNEQDPNAVYQYVRLRTGMGASDDLAIIFAGMMYGYSAAIGCYLADAVDTLEKYAGEYTDQDADISEYISKSYGNIGVTRDDAADLAYLCAIPDDMKGRLPDSSLRHLLEIDRKVDQCALESHICFVRDMGYAQMDLDHGQCNNIELYDYALTRWKQYKK